MYPVMLDLSGRLAVVIGGGPVGRRKTAGLLAAGGNVRLISLAAAPPDWHQPRVEWRQEPYHSGHLNGAALVFAAASAEVNRQVAADARQAGIWVNVADDPEASDFLVPATLRRGDFVVAVGTGGAAPALARKVRDRLAEQFDESFGQWGAILAELRPGVLKALPDPERRQALLESWCRWPWLELLRRKGQAAVRTALEAELAALVKADEQRL